MIFVLYSFELCFLSIFPHAEKNIFFVYIQFRDVKKEWQKVLFLSFFQIIEKLTFVHFDSIQSALFYIRLFILFVLLYFFFSFLCIVFILLHRNSPLFCLAKNLLSQRIFFLQKFCVTLLFLLDEWLINKIETKNHIYSI